MSSYRFIQLVALLPSLLVPMAALAAQTTLELSNGDTLTGEVTQESDTQITIKHAVLGTLTMDKSQVTVLAKTESDEAADVPVEEASEKVAEAADNGLFGTGILTDWKRRFDLGIAGSAGKTRNHQVNIGFSADYESEWTRIAHKTAYFRAKSEDDLSAHSFYTMINRDWLRPGTPWFHFAGGRMDWDQFKDWDYRANANGGIGYEFVKTDDWLLLGRSGLGFNQTFGGEREEFTPEGLLGIETQWDMNEHQHIEFTNAFYQSLTDKNEFRNVSTFDWVLDLNTFAGVALKVGLLNEYDSATEDDINENDFRYTVSLAWKL